MQKKIKQRPAGYTIPEWIAILSILILIILGMYISTDNQKTYQKRANKAAETYIRASPQKQNLIRKHLKRWIPNNKPTK